MSTHAGVLEVEGVVGYRRRVPGIGRESERFYREASDAELMRRAAERDDEAAFEQLVIRLQDRLYTFALRICRSPDEAADATQEGLLAAWRTRASFRGDSAVSTWMLTITRSKALDRIRRRDDALTIDDVVDPPAAPDHAPATATRLDVIEALRRLTPEFREVAVLADILKLPLSEIATITGAPENTVKTRLFRARAHLAGMLRGASDA
jgi:RNA polymerase sigma-70 factor (ECF subfamily)